MKFNYEKKLLADFLPYSKQAVIDAAIREIKEGYQHEDKQVHEITFENINPFENEYPNTEAGYVNILARWGDGDEVKGYDYDEWLLFCSQVDFALFMANDNSDNYSFGAGYRHEFIDAYVLGNERAIEDLFQRLRLKQSVYDSFIQHRKEYESECYPDQPDRHMEVEASNLKKWLDGLPILDTWYKLDAVEEAFIDYYNDAIVNAGDSWSGLMNPCSEAMGLGAYRYNPYAAHSLASLDDGSKAFDKSEAILDRLLEIFEIKNESDFIMKTLFAYWLEEAGESYIYNGEGVSSICDLSNCVYNADEIHILTHKEIYPEEPKVDALNGMAVMLVRIASL